MISPAGFWRQVYELIYGSCYSSGDSAVECIKIPLNVIEQSSVGMPAFGIGGKNGMIRMKRPIG
jgi:hypothetical protein